MANHHRGTGYPLDRVNDLHIEDSETTGLDNDNGSTSGPDNTDVLGGPEAEVLTDYDIHSNEAKLMTLMREINDLHQ